MDEWKSRRVALRRTVYESCSGASHEVKAVYLRPMDKGYSATLGLLGPLGLRVVFIVNMPTTDMIQCALVLI